MIVMEHCPEHTQMVCKFVCKFWTHDVLVNPAPKQPSDDFMYGVCSAGELEVLKWAREKGCPFVGPEVTLAPAAEGGHVELFKWVFANGCKELTEEVLGCSAFSGNKEFVLWVKEQEGCVWQEEVVCVGAATGGQHETLLWLRDVMGCPHEWFPSCCFAASMMGRVETLKWLRENGCAWSEVQCIEIAVIHGKYPILKFIKDTLGESGWKPHENLLVRTAGVTAMSIESLEWLRANGSISPESVAPAIESLQRPYGKEDGEDGISEADFNNNAAAKAKVVEWFKDNGYVSKS